MTSKLDQLTPQEIAFLLRFKKETAGSKLNLDIDSSSLTAAEKKELQCSVLTWYSTANPTNQDPSTVILIKATVLTETQAAAWLIEKLKATHGL